MCIKQSTTFLSEFIVDCKRVKGTVIVVNKMKNKSAIEVFDMILSPCDSFSMQTTGMSFNQAVLTAYQTLRVANNEETHSFSVALAAYKQIKLWQIISLSTILAFFQYIVRISNRLLSEVICVHFAKHKRSQH